MKRFGGCRHARNPLLVWSFFCKKSSGLIWFNDFNVNGRNAERSWDICRGLQASAKDYQVKTEACQWDHGSMGCRKAPRSACSAWAAMVQRRARTGWKSGKAQTWRLQGLRPRRETAGPDEGLEAAGPGGPDCKLQGLQAQTRRLQGPES